MPPMTIQETTVEKRYASIRYRGKPVEIRYRYDSEAERWTASSPNVPSLFTEGDSIEEIERELPDITELIVDTERRHGRAGSFSKRKGDRR